MIDDKNFLKILLYAKIFDWAWICLRKFPDPNPDPDPDPTGSGSGRGSVPTRRAPPTTQSDKIYKITRFYALFYKFCLTGKSHNTSTLYSNKQIQRRKQLSNGICLIKSLPKFLFQMGELHK